MKPKYINNLGNWKTDAQDECYLDNITFKIMKVVAGVSETRKSTTTQGIYLNLLKNFKDPFSHSFRDARFHSML